MGGINTGELYSQDQVDRMSPFEREEAGVVPLTAHEASHLQGLSKAERKSWLKRNKAPAPMPIGKSQLYNNRDEARRLKKRERQNRKAGRRAR